MRGFLGRCKATTRLRRALQSATAGWSNLPGAYTVASNQTMGSARPAGTGWTIYQGTGNDTTLVSDATGEPVSPPDALQVNLPTGGTYGGAGNEHQSYAVSSRTWSELYLGFSFLLSSNFSGASASGSGASGVQKLFHLWGYGQFGIANFMYLTVYGTGTTFDLELRGQGFPTPANPRGASFNLTSATAGTGQSTAIARGAWHRVEAQLVYNTASNADGIGRVWLNGTKVLEATDLVMNTSGTKQWTDLQLNPTHFASGWTATATQFLQFGHVVIAGKA